MDNNEIKTRIALLRNKMKENGIDACMITTSDDHNSEYTGDYFKVREFFSGFTGSNGTLVVTAGEAWLWTDGRYFIQAQEELKNSDIGLMRMGEPEVPGIYDYVAEKLAPGQTFGFDGKTISAYEGMRMTLKLQGRKINIKADFEPAEGIWTDRPQLSCGKVYPISDELAGESSESKIGRLRTAYKENGADGIIISKLDDIMWLFNIRGWDIECNPVALAYLYMDDDCIKLFLRDMAVDLCGAEILPYGSFYDFLSEGEIAGKIQMDPVNTNYRIYRTVERRLKERNGADRGEPSVISRTNPTENFKSVKNETELENIRKTYTEDSAALTRYIFWLKKYVREHGRDSEDGIIKLKVEEEIAKNTAGVSREEPCRIKKEGALKAVSDKESADDKEEVILDEYTAARVLDGMRAAIPGYLELSFPTIGAYKENGAIVHYEPAPESARPLMASGMYLVDSGGQYMGGTTDVTRTLVLGPVSDEIRKHYTLTVIGMLRLAAAVFMEGSTGRNVDILAREPLWKNGLDFKHGTGHGIGYILNVHEGPQNIRWKYLEGVKEAVLRAGMIVSDEPGVYIENSHGIRIENILEVVNKEKNQYGLFCGFDHLTYVPIDLEAIDTGYMEKRDIELLNSYHSRVYEKILPYMKTAEEAGWLKNACRNI